MTDNTATDTADRKLDLIARLLAKAESTTPAEAEALTEHAERLMVKYGIEQAMLEERRSELGQPSEQIVEVRILFTGTYARDLRELGGSVGVALGTIRLLQANAQGGAALYLVGFASDVQQARTLIASLEVQAMVALRAWWSGRRALYQGEAESVRRRARSSFIRGFAAGAARRIESNRAAVIQEAGTGTDLVLSSRRSRVDEVVDDLGLRDARQRAQADALSYLHGRASGEQANTGEREVTMGRGLESRPTE